MTTGKREWLLASARKARESLPGSDRARGGSAGGVEPGCYISIAERVKEPTFATLSHAHFPSSSLVNQLASDANRLRRGGIENPFVYTGIRKWMPNWAKSRNAEVESGSSTAADSGGHHASGNPTDGWLTVTAWHAAFSNYLVGAVAARQLTPGATHAHRNIVSEALAAPAFICCSCCFAVQSLPGDVQCSLVGQARAAWDHL